MRDQAAVGTTRHQIGKSPATVDPNLPPVVVRSCSLRIHDPDASTRLLTVKGTDAIAKTGEMHRDKPGALVSVLKRQALGVDGNERTDAGISPAIVGGRNGDGIAKSRVSVQRLTWQGRQRVAGIRDIERCVRGHRGRIAMAVRGHALHPLTDDGWNNGRALAGKLIHDPQRMVDHAVGQGWCFAIDIRPAVVQDVADPAQLRTQLGEVFDCRGLPVGEPRFGFAEQSGAVGQEFRGETIGVGMLAGNVIDRIACQGRVRPALQASSECPLGDRIRSWINSGFWKTTLKFFNNPCGITKNVRSDLEGPARGDSRR